MSRLRDSRLRQAWTQEELARRLDVTQGTVSHWENGDYPPLRKYRRKLCKIFGVSEEELFGEEAPK